MKQAQKIGQKGERTALDYLRKKGWKIIDRNHRLGHKEIDLIGIKKNKISLFEIKTRCKETAQIITKKQKQILRQAHLEFCEKYNLDPTIVNYALIVIYHRKETQASLWYYPHFL